MRNGNCLRNCCFTRKATEPAHEIEARIEMRRDDDLSADVQSAVAQLMAEKAILLTNQAHGSSIELLGRKIAGICDPSFPTVGNN